jgi:hypothetical protein
MPIRVCSQTAIYASGVGLGASKGKEVGKYQEGYTGYVNMVKDSVSHPFLAVTPLVSLLRSLTPYSRHESGTRAER